MQALRATFLVLTLALSACTPSRSAIPDPNAPLPPATSSDDLLPVTLHIHPLTRFGSSNGQPVIIAHLELRDRFNQNSRALGRVRLQVRGNNSAPSGFDAETDSPSDSTWHIDLSTPGRNAEFFDDLITRTYVLTIGDLPAWLVERFNPTTARVSAPTLSADFLFSDSAGQMRTISDSAHLSR